MYQWIRCASVLAAVWLSATAFGVQAAESAPTAVVGGQNLMLAGSGYRYKGPFKVNFIEVYAPARFRSLDELAKMDGPKRVVMTTQNETPSNFMGKSLTRGIEDNTPKGELSALVPSLVRMGELFGQHKTLAAGSKVFIDSVPGVGTVVTINGVQQGEPFKEPGLFKAIMSIWLGPIPVDFRLKDALLGTK